MPGKPHPFQLVPLRAWHARWCPCSPATSSHVPGQSRDVQASICRHGAKGVCHRHDSTALLMQDAGCPGAHIAKALREKKGVKETRSRGVRPAMRSEGWA